MYKSANFAEVTMAETSMLRSNCLMAMTTFGVTLFVSVSAFAIGPSAQASVQTLRLDCQFTALRTSKGADVSHFVVETFVKSEPTGIVAISEGQQVQVFGNNEQVVLEVSGEDTVFGNKLKDIEIFGRKGFIGVVETKDPRFRSVVVTAYKDISSFEQDSFSIFTFSENADGILTGSAHFQKLIGGTGHAIDIEGPIRCQKTLR